LRINGHSGVMLREEKSHDGLIQRTRTGASLEPCDLFPELIDPFLERAKSEFTNMLAGSEAFLRLKVKLLQFLQFQPRVLKLMPTVDGHGTTSTPRGSSARAATMHFWNKLSTAALMRLTVLASLNLIVLRLVGRWDILLHPLYWHQSLWLG